MNHIDEADFASRPIVEPVPEVLSTEEKRAKVLGSPIAILIASELTMGQLEYAPLSVLDDTLSIIDRIRAEGYEIVEHQ